MIFKKKKSKLGDRWAERLMASYDDREWFDAGDLPVDWGRVQEVADLFDRAASPLEALKALYGDDLEVPA